MTDAEKILAAREDQIDRSLPYASRPASQGDIMALEKTIMTAARMICETILEASY
jgi:hypothetical protein